MYHPPCSIAFIVGREVAGSIAGNFKDGREKKAFRASGPVRIRIPGHLRTAYD
jgi:hypothetical protein